ncbi:MAG: EamA family transporter [Dehalococcoidales bacterium]|nr:EamA family transporter [Dehalococcoidales bacterium]
MFWLSAALASAATAALVAIIDSHFLSKKMPSLRSYLLPVGLAQLAIGLVVFFLNPFPAEVALRTWLIAFGAGLTSSVAVMLMLNVMRRDEVSRVIPVVNTSPIFVAILAVPLLQEKLRFEDWLAILLTVGGAVLISMQKKGNEKQARLSGSFFLLLIVSLLFAVSNLAVKFALEELSYWNLYVITSWCYGLVFLVFALRGSTFKALRRLPQRNRNMAFIGFNEILAVGAAILSYVAIANGPVSMASAILNIRPAFVFLLAILVSRFLPDIIEERVTVETVRLKVFAMLMVLGGLAWLALTAR